MEKLADARKTYSYRPRRVQGEGRGVFFGRRARSQRFGETEDGERGNAKLPDAFRGRGKCARSARL